MHLLNYDLLVFEWTLDGEKERGQSPLRRVVGHHKKLAAAMDSAQAIAYAGANPEDHRFWVERARWGNMTKTLADLQRATLAIVGELRGFQRWNVAMTEFYEVYHFAAFHERVALLREYLLQEFTRQVLVPFAQKNDLDQNVTISPTGYPLSAALKTMLEGFERGLIGAECLTSPLLGGQPANLKASSSEG